MFRLILVHLNGNEWVRAIFCELFFKLVKECLLICMNIV